MKPSHYTTPRTLSDCVFQPWGEAIHAEGYTPRRDRIAGYLLATLIGIVGAVSLYAWSVQ